MIKIKISYETDQELKKMKAILKDHADKIKTSKNQEGKYKKAYVEIK